MAHPTMIASEAIRRAEAFVDHLISYLEQINIQYPNAAGVDEEALQAVRDANGGKLPGPEPKDQRDTFIQLFLSLIAKHYVIVPDEED